jgi:integrase
MFYTCRLAPLPWSRTRRGGVYNTSLSLGGQPIRPPLGLLDPIRPECREFDTQQLCFIALQDVVRSATWAGVSINERRSIVRQVLHSRAPSTVKKYLGAYQRYKMFLADTGRSTKLPTQSILVSTYLSQLCEQKSSYNAVLLAFCAIKWVHSLFPTNIEGNPADSPVSLNIVEASKRRFSKPPSKKEPLPVDVVRRVCATFGGPTATLLDLRTALIFSLGFSGLFRIGELLELQARDIVMQEDHVDITVRKSKTDQYRLGNKVFVAKTDGPACPYGLLSRFFRIAKIVPNSDQYIFRSANSLKQGPTKATLNKPISYSRCREIIKHTLGKVGVDPKGYSTHSLRSGGATAMAQLGTGNPSQSRLLRLQGRWRTDRTRDMYIKDSVENRLLLTRSLKL